MAIRAPGPRLFKSIPFRHIAANRKGSSGSAGVNVRLNVVPFVDMMTILVTFLLMVFASEGALLAAQSGLTLPDAARKAKLRRAPLIVVTKDLISFQGQGVARVQELAEQDSLEWKITELYDLMSVERKRFYAPEGGYANLSDTEKKYCDEPSGDPEELCLAKLVILQADKGTPVKVLNRVVKTAYAAEYVNILFAVNRRATR